MVGGGIVGREREGGREGERERERLGSVQLFDMYWQIIHEMFVETSNVHELPAHSTALNKRCCSGLTDTHFTFKNCLSGLVT